MKSQTLESDEHELGPPEFSSTITRIAVAQICESAGFKAAQRSALEALSDVAATYLQALAKSAASSATSAGRTHSNLFDVIHALEDLHSVQGFRGASNVTQTLCNSSTIVDIMKFVNYTDEIPFAKPIPRRDSPSKQSIVCRNLGSMNSDVSDRLNLKHVPRWLPAIPEIRDWGRGDAEEKLGWSCGEAEGGEGCLVGEKMVMEREKGKKKMELPAKRERVKFKMGVNVNNDVGFQKQLVLDVS